MAIKGRMCNRCLPVLLLLGFVLVVLSSPIAKPQQNSNDVSINVDFHQSDGPLNPVWDYFGYDEPNYTYAPNGRKLVGELAALSASTVYIRTHFMLATGDGEPSLKWGSTNAYTEEAGKPHYDWTITDRIFDTYLAAGAKPFVEIGFMPEALSTHPEPYRHEFPKSNFTGWSYPPRNYEKWSKLIFEWVTHCVKKYGARE